MAPRFLFGSSFRLKKGWEFDAVFRTGRQGKGEMVRLYFLRRPGERSRVGVTVGKKIANAAKRSRGRRLLRESLRRLLPWVKGEFWFVLSLREKALEADAVTVYADAARVLDRAGLLDDGWGGGNWPADARRFF
jgi:ribonuclease P protein component